MRPRAIFFAVILVGFFAATLGTQAQQPADPQVVAAFRGIASHAARLLPMLEQVRARDWVADGAPDTYAAQLESARVQVRAIGTEMAALEQHPDHMQDCMKGLFRVQAFHGLLDSLMGGLRKYQNPPLADLIQSVAAEDQADIEKLQTYILELADEKEQEFQVVDHEAQRCRALLSKQPVSKQPAAPPRK
jgi:hypothetical protein